MVQIVLNGLNSGMLSSSTHIVEQLLYRAGAGAVTAVRKPGQINDSSKDLLYSALTDSVSGVLAPRSESRRLGSAGLRQSRSLATLVTYKSKPVHTSNDYEQFQFPRFHAAPATDDTSGDTSDTASLTTPTPYVRQDALLTDATPLCHANTAQRRKKVLEKVVGRLVSMVALQ